MASPEQQTSIRLDLGRRASMQTIASVLDDISTVCTFGEELQRVADRNWATYEVLRRPLQYVDELDELELFDDPRWFEFYRTRPDRYPSVVAFPPNFQFQQSPGINRAINSWLQQNGTEDDARVTVQELHYRNPVELIILASGAVLLGVIKLVRDWPARRRLNNAVDENYRSVARDRERARQIALDQIETGDYRLSRAQMSDLLTNDVADALGALGDAPLEIEGPRRAGE